MPCHCRFKMSVTRRSRIAVSIISSLDSAVRGRGADSEHRESGHRRATAWSVPARHITPFPRASASLFLYRRKKWLLLVASLLPLSPPCRSALGGRRLQTCSVRLTPPCWLPLPLPQMHQSSMGLSAIFLSIDLLRLFVCQESRGSILDAYTS